METFQQISTETWKLLIPSDWDDGVERESGGFYFELPDETKGFYVTTWNFSDCDFPSNEAVIDHFRTIERESLEEMSESSWAELSNTQSKSEGISTAEFDFLDSVRNYRITIKVTAALPWVAQFSFHDYFCEDLDVSNHIVRPVVASFQIHNGAGD